MLIPTVIMQKGKLTHSDLAYELHFWVFSQQEQSLLYEHHM